ncbi:MAG: hypothetical protein IJ904_02605 [Candidatus Methanomethylophilaceae archaeon]|nr:hypothetical protein [Candidatus Methanomethylophilaceae archaeon]
MNVKTATLVTVAIFTLMFLAMCIAGFSHEEGLGRSVYESEPLSFDLCPGDESGYETEIGGMNLGQRFGLTGESGLYKLTIKSNFSGCAADRVVMECLGESGMDGLSVSSGGTMEVCQSSIAGGTTVTATDGSGTRFGSGFVSEFRGNGSTEGDVCNEFCFKMYESQCELRIWTSISYGHDSGSGLISQEFNIRVLSNPSEPSKNTLVP